VISGVWDPRLARMDKGERKSWLGVGAARGYMGYSTRHGWHGGGGQAVVAPATCGALL
jgi:hypothetical protein